MIWKALDIYRTLLLGNTLRVLMTSAITMAKRQLSKKKLKKIGFR